MMTTTTTLHTRQHFTDNGRRGVALALLSPVILPISYAWMLHAMAVNDNVGLAVIAVLGSSVAFVAGCIMVLIGRTQLTTVQRVRTMKGKPEAW